MPKVPGESLRERIQGASANELRAMVDQCLAEERLPALLGLWRAITAATTETHGPTPGPEVLYYIENRLALTTSLAHVDALFTLLGEARAGAHSPGRLHYLACCLGAHQSKDATVATIARLGHDEVYQEILACWMQETVSRGLALEDEPVAQAFHARLAARGHPLAALPLALLEIEHQAPLRLPRWGSSWCLQPERGTPPRPKVRSPDLLPRATRVEAAQIESRLHEAVRPWTTESNGTIEAKVFRIEPSVAGLTPGRWLLRALPLDCLADASEIQAEPATVADVWTALFSAAVAGGAYGWGLQGAYARRAAWSSLGALIDAPADEGPIAMQARARDCRFLQFMASTPWFHDVAWDLGFVAVRADGNTVAVLAASDTD